jgi:hypothetical protein
MIQNLEAFIAKNIRKLQNNMKGQNSVLLNEDTQENQQTAT